MDPYEILGVTPQSTQDEIKSAYRKLASKHHPDRGGDTSVFQNIQSAYSILTDPQKYGEWQASKNIYRGYEGNINPFADILNQFMRQTRQRIYTVTVLITLEQVATGGRQNIQINTGSGSKLIEINIPQGISDGQTIRYDGIMADGWLQITFRCHEHPVYRRHGLDLESTVDINLLQLLVGADVEFTDIYGNTVQIKVPEMTKPGTKFRVPRHGLKNGPVSGDHYLLINPVLPDRISGELQTLIKTEIQKATNATKSGS